MNFFCDVLPNVPAMAGAPIIEDVRLMFPDLPETEALEHWVLGGSSDSLLGRKGVSNMTLAGAQPTYFPNYAETALGARNGLLTGFADADQQAFAMVMHFTDSGENGGRILIGSGTASSGPGSRLDGFVLSQSTGNAASPNQLQCQYRLGTNFSPFPAAVIEALIGKWIFIGMATDMATKVQSFYIHGVGHVARAPDSATWGKATVAVAIGNGYYAPSSGQASRYDRGIEVAEAMVLGKVPTPAMWSEIAQRAVMRSALRGLSVYAGE